MLGAIGGGILGISTAMLLASQFGAINIHSTGLRGKIRATLKNMDWKETAKDVIENIGQKLSMDEDEEESGHKDILDYALMALRFLQNVKRRG